MLFLYITTSFQSYSYRTEHSIIPKRANDKTKETVSIVQKEGRKEKKEWLRVKRVSPLRFQS